MRAKQFFYIMCVALLLSVVGSVTGFLWADKQLKQKSRDVSSLIADRDVQNDSIEKLKASKKTASDTSSISDLVSAALPKQKKQETLVADIIRIANSTPGMTGTNISNFGFNGSGSPDSLSGALVMKDISGVYNYPFTLQIKDISYTTLLELLQRIELNKRIIQVDQIQIVPDKAKAGYISSVSLSLKTFIQP
jgi:hypothetical protein